MTILLTYAPFFLIFSVSYFVLRIFFVQFLISSANETAGVFDQQMQILIQMHLIILTTTIVGNFRCYIYYSTLEIDVQQMTNFTTISSQLRENVQYYLVVKSKIRRAALLSENNKSASEFNKRY
ncbi:hypothetical protein T06_4425 [Trichinella sp. T6]|nr:hypothetical protein T06_4425 [Trichinella sp. T6]